jgi:hypothetical protein
MTPDPAIATAADYADAMIVARRAKNALGILILLILIVQFALFLLVRFDVLAVSATAAISATTAPATQPTMSDRVPHYFSSGFMFLGVTMSVLLSFVLLLIVNIMLVGRLIGVARVTGAYLWSLVLMLFLFPWQAFLDNFGLPVDQAGFKVPGVLYTWSELMDPTKGAHFAGDLSLPTVLHWVRYVVFPLLAVFITLIIQVKSNRGIRQALGEEATTTPASNA